MQQDTTDTRFALEGFLPLWAIVLLGVGLLALSWWMARRDKRFADRPKIVSILFALRCVAVLVLLWMLAGPTLVTTARKFRTKSVALLVDTSASMGLVDVIDGSGNVSRWSAARTDSTSTAAVRKLDEAVTTLRVAQNQLERFSKIPNSTTETADARAAFARAAQGIKTAIDGLKRSAGDMPDSAAHVKRGLLEASAGITGQVLDTLQNKSAEFNRGKTLASLERERWLPKDLAVLSLAAAQVEGFADQFVKLVEAPAAKSPGEVDARESKLARIDKVDAFLANAETTWLKDIRKKAVVSRYEFGEKVVPLGTAPLREQHSTEPANRKSLSAATQIGAALQQVAIDSTSQPVEAAILITDGGHNAGVDPRELAASLSGTTLHIVPIGNTKIQRDVILHHTHAPKAVLQNDHVVIDSIVTAYDCEKEQLQVELLDNGAVVDRQTLNVTSEVFDNRVQLRWRAAQIGKHTLGFRVIPVSDERTDENNASKADIHVMEDKIRVLVADNFPRWETRYLLNLFKRDDRVEFDQLLFEPQASVGSGVRADFPRTLEEWSKYRIVILGDVLPAQLTYEHQKLLREYVTEAGGNLIIVAGKDAMPAAYLTQPLGAMLPVEQGDRAVPNNPFYLHLTDEGSMTLATQIAENPGLSERLWREMSERLPIYALSEFSRPKPTTHSLIWASLNKSSFNPADPSTRAFLSWQYIGAGRVVYVAAPVTYQLRYRQGDTFHHRFWGQLLRWAVARDLAEGSQTVRLSTDKSRYENGEAVQVSVRLRQLDGKAVGGAALQIAAVHEGRLIQEITLKEDPARAGTYHGRLPALPVGPVKLEAGGERVKALLAQENYRRPVETTVNIDPSGVLELRHPLCNLPLLRQVADASSGIVLPPTGLKAALQALNLNPEVLENVTKKPLWNRWDLFWLFILCLTLEWAGRKYLGLS
jgi:hypothetical protein